MGILTIPMGKSQEPMVVRSDNWEATLMRKSMRRVATRPTCVLCLGRVGILAFCLVLPIACFGCNTSRYGVTYDQRLPGIRHVHILPTHVQFQSIHAGGMLEARPDLTKEVRLRLLIEIQRVTQKKNVIVTLADWEEAYTIEVQAIPQSLALLNAIEQSILTHHYHYGKKRVFDHTIAEPVKELPLDSGDAILLVRLVATVPTAGRVGLAVTAAIVGGLTGANVYVQTHYAELALMLVDAETGDVLWYNIVVNQADARNERVLRNLVKKAGHYMLEPRKK